MMCIKHINLKKIVCLWKWEMDNGSVCRTGILIFYYYYEGIIVIIIIIYNIIIIHNYYYYY